MLTTTSILALAFAGISLTTATSGDQPSGYSSSNGEEVVSYIAKFDDAPAGVLDDLPVRGFTPLGP
jgi:hypothetical protein